MNKKRLTIKLLREEAKKFAKIESKHDDKKIYGTTDGKAVGTYFEHKFQKYLENKYTYSKGNSARGIDFPELNVDMKVTSIKQPQSSCPFKLAEQKIFGLGYSLLVFVYEKSDNEENKTGKLNILHTVFVNKNRTADYQLTFQIHQILKSKGNKYDLIALFNDKNLPIDDITAETLAERILIKKPEIGYLTISNALQWRLQYSRIIEKAGKISGVFKVL